MAAAREGKAATLLASRGEVLVAGGSAGVSAQASAELYVFASFPDPPIDVVAIAGQRAATVSFRAPGDNGGSPVTGYHVTASPGGASIAVAPAARSVAIGGLTAGVAYTFSVTATNAFGTSQASGASNAVIPTGPLVVPAQCRVPALRKRTLASARKALVAAHCALGSVRKPKHAHGTLVVVSQTLPAGSVYRAGTAVGLRLGVKKAAKRRR
jgi:fibronectin type III domain protein